MTAFAGAGASYSLITFISLAFYPLQTTVSVESTASIEKLAETGRSTDRSNISLDNDMALNGTDSKADDLLLSDFPQKSSPREKPSLICRKQETEKDLTDKQKVGINLLHFVAASTMKFAASCSIQED
ncbi:hypothetical protein LOAG_04846 [Loa loa]|uniref:Uncharacterized protein n=1 Tax=Loa loa TaxID=7209 RepID=A0A1S0U1I2_LOALO|nr:hypothetical protein LOAG_04846 [Loa loa]EFO23635.1 hypothetical protein LOAG_04846 [Loa loa]